MRTFMAAAMVLGMAGTASAGDFTGTLGFGLGVGGGTDVEHDKLGKSSGDLGATTFIVPGLDKRLGKTVGVGGEVAFTWFSPSKGDGDAVLAISPMLRLSMAFPVANKITVDAMLAAGISSWSMPDSDRRFGFAYRFAFGGSYQFNDTVAAFGSLGYFAATTYGDDLTITNGTIPLMAGLRSTF